MLYACSTCEQNTFFHAAAVPGVRVYYGAQSDRGRTDRL